MSRKVTRVMKLIRGLPVSDLPELTRRLDIELAGLGAVLFSETSSRTTPAPRTRRVVRDGPTRRKRQ